MLAKLEEELDVRIFERTDKQRDNVRRIDGDYLSQRRISLYVKEDYVRQRMLNTITDTLKEFMPEGMLTEGIIKYGIRL